MNNKLFCFGYGYSCDYLGHELLSNENWSVSGTTRSNEKKQSLRSRGVQAYIFDYEHPLPDPAYILEDTTHLIISTPPSDEGDPAFVSHAEDILKLKNLQWVGYLSTTGVYGNRDGDWVNENSELRPSSKRGSRRVKAEEQWQSLYKNHDLPLHIFRLAGIYGPGRSALDTVRVGTARRINKPGHIFSRIHVEDITNILLASMAKPNPGAIYNVCDDNPAPSHEIISYACEILGRPEPELINFDEADMTPMARSFYSDNKLVNNNRIKEELDVQLKYPNFKEGLKACMDAEKHAIQLFKKPFS
ncbi:MAG: NAD(P)-dependent oxidoreductase [Micavibrio sp. TMED27]|nr:NAD(P)-dependent oxidoreductase [Micavibrio sp.]OUT91244.1 MAG: NAD(P)-dependent oxidoreductase [Micavibrio sp. TMED27]